MTRLAWLGVPALPVAVALVLVSACSDETVCTLIGMESGVIVRIDPQFAPKVAKVKIRVCRKDRCATDQQAVQLLKGGDLDGEGRAFIQMNEASLPDDPVSATVQLFDPAGGVIGDQNFDVTPTVTYPNGKDCAPKAISLAFRVDSTGHVSSVSQRDG